MASGYIASLSKLAPQSDVGIKRSGRGGGGRPPPSLVSYDLTVGLLGELLPLERWGPRGLDGTIGLAFRACPLFALQAVSRVKSRHVRSLRLRLSGADTRGFP